MKSFTQGNMCGCGKYTLPASINGLTAAARPITPPKENFNIPVVFVLGWIEYADDLDPPTVRRTAFCRMFDRKLERFVISGDFEPDYETCRVALARPTHFCEFPASVRDCGSR